MKKLMIIGAILLAVLSLVVLLTANLFSGVSGKVVVTSVEPVFLTVENVDEYLEATPIVQDLPKESSIEIYFGEEAYSVDGSNVEQTPSENADIIVRIDEEYLNKEWGSICELAKEAVKNRDVSVETSLSNAQLLWKYRGMLKYKSCVTG